MDIETVRAFFGWCTVINGAFLLLSFVFCAKAGDCGRRNENVEEWPV